MLKVTMDDDNFYPNRLVVANTKWKSDLNQLAKNTD